MADDGDRDQEKRDSQQGEGSAEGKAGKSDEDAGDGSAKDPSFRAYLKLFGTILVSLLLFAAIMRGCAACQDKNPLTGEPTQQQAPAPPPPPPAPPPEPEK